MNIEDYKLIIVPGYSNSDDTHWQSLWNKKYNNSIKVAQENWFNPDYLEWITNLDKVINKNNTPIILVGHSLGALLIVHWLNSYKNYYVHGVFLVAPCDIELNKFQFNTDDFVPIPEQPLKIPSILVFSSNDKMLSVDRAIYFCNQWKSRACCIGNAGHINTASGFGEWSYGEKLLLSLL